MRPSGQGGGVNTNFKVVKLLGKGSYGTVFQVQRISDNKTYALKEMDVRAMNQAEREDAANEIRLLASVQHPNIISYNEAFLDGNRLCIIMEYAADGDLAKVIKKYQLLKRPLPEDLIWKYWIQVTRGLAALHNTKILHRDIKPGNIMVMENDVAKIGDLGIAKLLKQTMAAKTQIGTPHYMPPEIWKNRPYSFTSDSWAMGCILYEMATLKVPFEARSVNELRYKVLKGTYPAIPSTYSRELQQMVRDCLDQIPEKRPTMDQILASHTVQTRLHLLPSEGGFRKPPSTAGSALLDTIKVPRNFQMIKGKLPPAQYKSEGLAGFGGAIYEAEDEAESYSERRPAASHHGAFRPQHEYKVVPPSVHQRPPPPAAAAALPPPSMFQSPQNAAGHHLPSVQTKGAHAQKEAVAAVLALEMAKNAGNVYSAYNKEPPPPIMMPKLQQHPHPQQQQQHGLRNNGDARPWYVKDPARRNVSESHAAYGAFYNSPSAVSAAAAAQGRALQAGVGAKQPEQYKGYYTPAVAAAGQAQIDAARAMNWPPQGKLQPVQYDRRQGAQVASLAGGGPQAAAAAAAAAVRALPGPGAGGEWKPPPWNYGGGGAKVSPVKSAVGWQGGFQNGAVQGAAVGVARYPPIEWQAPRMR